MEEERSSKQAIYINLHVNPPQNAETRVEADETNIINPTIDQSNVKEANNDATKGPVAEEQIEINQAADILNLSGKYGASTSSDQDSKTKPRDVDNNEIKIADDLMNQALQSTSTSIRQRGRIITNIDTDHENYVNDEEKKVKIELFIEKLLLKSKSRAADKRDEGSDFMKTNNAQEPHDERPRVRKRNLCYLNIINICVLVCLVASVFDDIGIARGNEDNKNRDHSKPNVKNEQEVQWHHFYWDLIIDCLMVSVAVIFYCIGLRKGRCQEKEYLLRKWKKEKEISDRKTIAENRAQKFQSFKSGLITVQAATLCGESKFQVAESQLEKLTNIPLENVEVSTLLLKAEVLIELEKKDKAKEVMNEIVRLSMATLDVGEIFSLSQDFIDDNSYVRALVLLRILSDMFKLHPSLSPDGKVKKIRDCVFKMYNVVDTMTDTDERLKKIDQKYGISYMIEMLHDLLAVENVDKPDIKALYATACIHWIGISYNGAHEYEQSIEIIKSGIDIMGRQFDVNASKYNIYGDLLYWLGIANINLDRYRDAEDNFKKAFDAYSNASDYYSEDSKQKDIEYTNKRLKEVHEKIK